MGLLRKLLTAGEAPAVSPLGKAPPVVAARGTTLEVASVARFPGIGRDSALSVPTVLACRNLIVGCAIQLGVRRYRGNDPVEPGTLLTQPDPDTTWAVTLSNTLEDLLFDGCAYWLILAHDGERSELHPSGLPVRARWIPFGDVTPLTTDSPGSYSRLTGYDVAGVGRVEPAALIRFDSALPAILYAGARLLQAALALEEAARRLSTVELPAGVLTNEGAELNQDEADAVVADFQAKRLANMVTLLQGVKYERTQLSSHDLQLVEARAHVATEVTRLFSIPVTMVGASPSGNAAAMLYSNLTAQLAAFVQSAVMPHLRTVESTLSLPSVTPRGQSVAFDVQSYLRSDPAAAAEYAVSLYEAGVSSRDESRSFLGLPPAGDAAGDDAPTPAPTSLEPGRI